MHNGLRKFLFYDWNTYFSEKGGYEVWKQGIALLRFIINEIIFII